MPNREIKSLVAPSLSLAPKARTTSENGTGVDLRDYDAASVEFSCGVLTDGTHTPSVEESDDDSSYTAVATADLLGTLAALSSGSVQQVGYRGVKRYIRAVMTISGGPGTGAVSAANVLLGAPKFKPVS